MGTAVVLSDKDGAGPMVDSESFDTLRQRNFGCTTLGLMPTEEVLSEQIAHYNADDALRVCGKTRSEASLGSTLPSIVAMYRAAISQFNEFRPAPDEESYAMAAYIRRMSDIIKVKRLIKMRRRRVIGRVVKSLKRLIMMD